MGVVVDNKEADVPFSGVGIGDKLKGWGGGLFNNETSGSVKAPSEQRYFCEVARDNRGCKCLKEVVVDLVGSLGAVLDYESHSFVKNAEERARAKIKPKGGIDTNEISSSTMECKKHSGLYFVGEVLDVTGHLGGHNFQWAWSSGFVAGQNV